MRSEGSRPAPSDEGRTSNSEADFRRRRLIAIGGIVLFLAICALLIRACVGDGSSDGESAQDGGSVSQAAPPPAPTALELNRENGAEQGVALERVLGYTPFLKQGTRGARNVALTFDDGPGAQTEQILAILRRHDAPSTFYLNGYVLDDREDIVRKIVREGHAIGNHGQDHAHMAQLSMEGQADQIDAVTDRLRRTGVEPPRTFRPPYGSFNQETLDLLERKGMLMVLWSIDTTDYAQPGADAIVTRTLDEVQPGSVILMHDAGGDRTQTIEALPKILRGLKQRNLSPVTVPELLTTNPPPRGQELESAVEVPPPGVASVG